MSGGGQRSSSTPPRERSQDDRRAYLERACGDDAELRRHVEILVAADEEGGSFLDEPLLASFEPKYAARSLVGSELGPYCILSWLGAGGMGEVYRAHDRKLGRDVAIKTLPAEFAHDPDRLERFRREARSLALLNHASIAAIYGLEDSGDTHYLVLELVEGETLRGPVPFSCAIAYATQIADALHSAHKRGIVHRDLKPANLKVTPEGKIKVLDFGLAKAIGGLPDEPGSLRGQSESGTLTWRVVGTPGYMSPEQARGAPVDPRTDIWAFGCLLYELLTGSPAFKRGTVRDTLSAILEQEPDWRALPPGTPEGIRRLLRGCLEKDPDRRVNSMADVLALLGKEQLRHNRRRLLAIALRPRYAIPAAVVFALLCLAGLRVYQQNSRVRWVKEYAIPEIARLLDSGDSKAAFRMLRRAEAVSPEDPDLTRIRRDSAFETPITTNPQGAEVWATGYDPGDNHWARLGTTPLIAREPWGFYRFRIQKSGFRTVLATGEVRGGTSLHFELDIEGSIPAEMERVPGGPVSISGFPEARLSAFLIDRFETTNRQFMEFIDHGGYRKREYWEEDFVRDGQKIPWEEAISIFHDSTGLPGPATWQSGTFPPGQDDFPVNGVSWYEAAAYAEFKKKQLPTIYHWHQAAAPGFYADITDVSNFSGVGPARVGSYHGLGAFGTLDMAGNVREWCSNAAAGRRCIRGGAWSDLAYMFSDVDAVEPWDRSAQNGIRCVRFDAPGDAAIRKPISRLAWDHSREKPVSDDVFRHFRSLYGYDSRDLKPLSEGIDEDTPDWRREKVTFAAPYENERITAYLYIPKRAKPPYQAVVYGNPGMALRLASPQPAEERFFDFLVKSGRAFLVPVLKGYYQRRYPGPPAGPNAVRDRLILESKDFRRSIDYLMSRPDVDRERIGVYCLSRAACLLPVLAVGEQRLKAAVLVSVGLPVYARWLPESDPLNFVSRFRTPTLMVNGRSDFVLPLETSQLPMFRLLGTPARDKRLSLYDGGHAWTNFQPAIKEGLEWFDRYLGPVK